MKKILLILPLALLSCSEASQSTDSENAEQPSGQTEMGENIEEKEKEQTTNERIAEIKKLYADLQKLDKKNQKCTSAMSITQDGLDPAMSFPFENTAEECNMDQGFKYKRVELNGYEWTETCTFYYKDDQLFFVLQDGASEAYAYLNRVYYDKKGEVISVLSAENDYDGDNPGSPKEVEDDARRKEIVDGVKYSLRGFESIMKTK